jgi:hypothetical protein
LAHSPWSVGSVVSQPGRQNSMAVIGIMMQMRLLTSWQLESREADVKGSGPGHALPRHAPSSPLPPARPHLLTTVIHSAVNHHEFIPVRSVSS